MPRRGGGMRGGARRCLSRAGGGMACEMVPRQPSHSRATSPPFPGCHTTGTNQSVPPGCGPKGLGSRPSRQAVRPTPKSGRGRTLGFANHDAAAEAASSWAKPGGDGWRGIYELSERVLGERRDRRPIRGGTAEAASDARSRGRPTMSAAADLPRRARATKAATLKVAARKRARKRDEARAP